MTGGKGSSMGGFWGALFLQMIISIILSLRVGTMAKDLVQGMIILLGIVGTLVLVGKEGKKKKKNLLALDGNVDG